MLLAADVGILVRLVGAVRGTSVDGVFRSVCGDAS
jgi:hypothetical protein